MFDKINTSNLSFSIFQCYVAFDVRLATGIGNYIAVYVSVRPEAAVPKPEQS